MATRGQSKTETKGFLFQKVTLFWHLEKLAARAEPSLSETDVGLKMNLRSLCFPHPAILYASQYVSKMTFFELMWVENGSLTIESRRML
mmetsp:Transcript_34147/g.133687  ORF Transcript_34147/g.133687 Transcript_34147/m.133687 type:complete len:89 (-) Transcript_34147:449-715(-)